MEILNIINGVCIVGIGYCIAKYIFNSMPYHIVKLESISEKYDRVTVKRLWKKYKYVCDVDFYDINDIDNNIFIQLRSDK